MLKTATLLLQICHIVTLSCLFLTPAGARGGPIVQTFQSAGRRIVYEIFDNATPDAPLLILLPGTSGPAGEFYRSQAAMSFPAPLFRCSFISPPYGSEL